MAIKASKADFSKTKTKTLSNALANVSPSAYNQNGLYTSLQINPALNSSRLVSNTVNYSTPNQNFSKADPSKIAPKVNQTTSNNNNGVSTSGGSIGNNIASVVTASEGGILPQRIDLTDILAAYEQGSSAQRKTITDSSASQRQSLLDSLKRFQQETAEARAQQQRGYNAGRADLEGQAFMANRQAAQSAAARGLGGSGLQQLAQIQNLVNQSNATNTLAQSNIDVLKAIATAAQNKEEDTNKAIANLEKEAENKLAQIEANNAEAKANLQYKEDVRYEEARRAAEQFAAQLEASNRAAAQSYSNYLSEKENEKAEAQEAASNLLNTALQQGISAIKNARSSLDYSGIDKSKAIRSAYENAQNSLYGILADTGLNFDLNPYLNQLASSFNTYYNTKHKYR